MSTFQSPMKALKGKKRTLVRFLTRKIYYPMLFNLHALFKPIQEDKVVFLELRLPSLSNSFQELYNELARNYDLNIHCHFFRIGFVDKADQYKRMRDFVIDAATAKYLIYAEGSDLHACIRKRKGQHILNTWHAAGAFKKFGLSTADKIFGDSYKDAKRFPSHGDYDIVTVSSPEIVWAYAEAMDKKDNPECIKPLGLSRTDVFYRQETVDKAYEHLYRLMPQAKGKKIISYAPTFRGRAAKALTPDMLDVKKFKKELSDDYVLIFKHHPITHNRPVVPAECADFAADFTEELTIEELICVTDIMIADYSSTIFEYSLFEKPMVFFAYDLYNYFDWRGFYYNYDELTPGPVCFTNGEVIDYIKHVDERFDKAEVIAFKEKFMKSCDGHATERIMKEFFEPSLENYRRSTPLDVDYHACNSWEQTFSNREKTLKNNLKVQKIIKPVYEKASKNPVKKNSVVLLADKRADRNVFDSLEKAFEAKGGFEVTLKPAFTIAAKDKLHENAKKLAEAEYIIAAGEPFVLRMVKIRPETKIVQICPEIIPALTRENNSKALIAGSYKEEIEAFPIINSYDIVAATDVSFDEATLRNYPLSESGKVINVGNVCSDIFFNEKLAEKAKEKIVTDFSFAEGKKIISLIISYKDVAPEKLTSLLQDLHEEFARNCVVLLRDYSRREPIEFDEYLQGFAFWTDMPLSRCMAASDVVIGDFGGFTFGALAFGKDFYRWIPDKEKRLDMTDLNMKEEDLLSANSFESNEEMVSLIKEGLFGDKSSDAYKAHVKACEEYKNSRMSLCDGKASTRFVEELANA